MRLAQCGFHVGLCKLLLKIFDSTLSVVCIGSYVGRHFKEKLGVREGAVESPHLFNVFIDDLRARLEMDHPNLCVLLGLTLAVLLYADDAALPADSATDLQKSLDIFENIAMKNDS